MNKERELLRRISSHSESRIPAHFIYELKELLAQPEQDQIFKVIEKNRFNEGLMVGLESSNRTLVEAAEAKQDWLKDNERLTNLLLEAEDKIQELLAQPEQEPVNFDLERMKLAVESPVSDVTVAGLIDKVKSNREHIVDVTDKVEPVAWMYEWYENDLESTQAYCGSEKPFKGEIKQPFNLRPLYTAPPSAVIIIKAHGIGGGE